MRARHQLDQVGIGVVAGQHVRVALVNDVVDLRPSNPGVRAIRDAMVECLDCGEPIRVAGDGSGTEFRLHAVWRHQRGGGVVGSVPLLVDDRIVAIVTVAAASDAALSEKTLQALRDELVKYAPLLPIARLAVRSWRQHTLDLVAGWWQRQRRRGRSGLLIGGVVAAAFGWLSFGTIPYRLTVPCVVKAVDRRVVSSPRGGVLSELYVRPGDQVTHGQLLAELDSHDDALTKAELEAEVMSLDAQIDLALGEGDSGKLRVLEAQRDSVLAKISVVAQRIEHAQVRAPIDGVVLSGELREKLGARLAMGESMFELARYDGATVEMRVPETQVLLAGEARSATFVAAATPDIEHELRGFRLSPASSVVDGHNVFLAEAGVAETIGSLPPGMEGFALLDVGPRRAIWVLTHRAVDWLRLNFWL